MDGNGTPQVLVRGWWVFFRVHEINN
jgi:hypothetical protein